MHRLVSQHIHSPIGGGLCVCASGRSVRLLEFAGTQRIVRKSRRLEKHFACRIIPAKTRTLARLLLK